MINSKWMNFKTQYAMQQYVVIPKKKIYTYN